MSSIYNRTVAQRLTRERLSSYLSETGGDLREALGLYDWNIRAGAAMHEDIGRFEVVFRNIVADTLVEHGEISGWEGPWYQQHHLFRGKQHEPMSQAIARARDRATRHHRPEVYGKVIAELNLGFWRYLCHKRYLTSLWVPAIRSAFPLHPETGNSYQIRQEVENRMQKFHFTRNRIAHHEPIHRRDLNLEHEYLLETIGWMCADSRSWVKDTSRTPSVLAARPTLEGYRK